MFYPFLYNFSVSADQLTHYCHSPASCFYLNYKSLYTFQLMRFVQTLYKSSLQITYFLLTSIRVFLFHSFCIFAMARHSMFIIIAVLLLVRLTNYGGSAWVNKSYVRNACSVTTYRDLCIRSLASFSTIAKTSPSKWARAGVSVTISQVKSANQYLNNLNKQGRMNGRNRVALLDCIEGFENALDELHKSLAILRKISARNFDKQMGDLNTFMSAALTDENTCLDGFAGRNGSRVTLIKTRVLNSTYFTSNALDLVAKLSTSGIKNDP